MNKKKVSLFFVVGYLIISVNIANQKVYCATDEGYGEAETALGQFVDSFENSNNVSVMEDVIQNSTLNCMELNVTVSGVVIYENFTEYTEVEPNNRVDVQNDTHIAHNAQRDEDSYAYYNYGVDYFGDFIHTVTVESDYVENQGLGVVWMVSDTVDDILAVYSGNNFALTVRMYRSGVDFRMYLMEYENGNAHFDWTGGLAPNTLYYLNISKSGTDFRCDIWDDVGMTSNVDNLTITLQADYELEYIFACNTWNSAENIVINTDIYNLWIGKYSGGFEDDGYFTTDDYMNDTSCNGTTLGLMVNSSIPGNTDIQVQFSNDNATWGDWEGIPLDSNILSGGFETIDLRYLNETDCYLRFNLSTTDSSVTPRIYQARIISTIGNQTGGAAPGPSGDGIGWMMLFLIGVPLIVIIVWGNRRR